MLDSLTEMEARVVACLIEKSIVTPDQYPMTLNSLRNACNQKSSRDPVMSMTQGEVLNTLRSLEGKHLVRTEENFKSRTDKYSQRFCSTRYSNYQFDDAQVAVVCLLLLRGPQTPGELRTRSGRLHTFEDNSAVVATLTSLIEHDGGAVVTQLPRVHGRKDSEYMHLFFGAVDIAEYEAQSQAQAIEPRTAAKASIAELGERVEQLEHEVAALKRQLANS